MVLPFNLNSVLAFVLAFLALVLHLHDVFRLHGLEIHRRQLVQQLVSGSGEAIFLTLGQDGAAGAEPLGGDLVGGDFEAGGVGSCGAGGAF